jgi:hypothetical protein
VPDAFEISNWDIVRQVLSTNTVTFNPAAQILNSLRPGLVTTFDNGSVWTAIYPTGTATGTTVPVRLTVVSTDTYGAITYAIATHA